MKDKTNIQDSQPGQVKLPKTAADVAGPVSGTTMTREYVKMVGKMAYIWGWPLVSSHNRRGAFAQAPVAGLMGGVLPVAPVGQLAFLTDYISPEQRFVTCPNQDVVYGMGYYALDKEPIVFQVPDFGDRFWVYALYDARTDQFAEIGKAHGTTPGFYMMVGPNWQGQTPSGMIAVVQSSTELAASAPRIFLNDTPEDREAIQPLLNQIMFYPLSQFDGKMKTTDWRKLPKFPPAPGSGKEETKWVVPENFFAQLPEVMKLVTPLPGEEALYKWIGSVLEASDNDPEVMKILNETAIAADEELIKPLFAWTYNGVPAGNGWNSPKNNAQWGSDYFSRAATARSNMYDNRPNETKYIYRDFDSAGKQLTGKNSYTLTFAKGQTPPVKGFWSLTLYNDKHFFEPNTLNRFSLGTKNKTLQYNPDGSLTLYSGAKSPGKDKESNWLPAPNGTFSLYIRAYWAEQSILDGTWMPPQVEKVK
jgi:hypothetical protein